MKRIRGLPDGTPGLKDYLEVETQGASWDAFHSHLGGRAHRGLIEELVDLQHGLCGYCEIRLTELDRQVEHVVPQSDPVQGASRALDFRNLIACCKGGTWRSSDGSRYLRPVRQNRTCGEEKGARRIKAFLDPRELPAAPSLARVLEDGRIEADVVACTSAGVSAGDVNETIEMLNLNSLWQKSIDRSRPESTEWRRFGGMAMGKKPAARQPSPMWVTTADLPTSAGHPFFERLNRVLEEAGFDAFVEGLCAVFYASRLGRPSLRPGRYFRLLFIGYFEGLSSERGIAWRVADSLSLRAFLDLDVTEAPPNHSTLSRTRRLIDVETHVAVFTWVLERLAGAGLVQGKTVGVDATTLEANAAMRSIERRDTGESYEAFVRQLAKASGIETPTRAELARFDRSRKDRKTSNKEWQSPQDPDAKIAKMKDGRTHLAHKAEHGIDLETGAILSVTVQEASEGDSAMLPATLTMAAEQVEAVQPAGAEVEEVVADKGYHSDATLVALDEIGVRSYVSEPERGRRCWQDKKTGETPVEKRAAQKALYGNRRRIRGDRGRRLQRRRGELVERPFAHQYETGGLRRVWVRGHENVRKRVLIQAAGCNLGLLLRRLTGVGTPRSLQGRALSAICGLIGRLTALWGRLTASWDFQWTPAGLVRLNRSSPSCLNRPAQRTAFFHGLLNARRLRIARERRWRALSDAWGEWTERLSDPDQMHEAARRELLPANGRLSQFFTTARSYFGPLAERVLDEPPRAWI